jgi:hypothetical protein
MNNYFANIIFLYQKYSISTFPVLEELILDNVLQINK